MTSHSAQGDTIRKPGFVDLRIPPNGQIQLLSAYIVNISRFTTTDNFAPLCPLWPSYGPEKIRIKKRSY